MLIWIGLIVLTVLSAIKLERRVWVWALLGFLCGPFALAAIWIMGRDTPTGEKD